MARPPLALGHHGTIKTFREDGSWVALCRYRDLDGVTRKVTRRGSSKSAAQKALQEALRDRSGDRSEKLLPDARFTDASELWMAKINERREDSTADTYRHWLNALVLPELGHLRLYECTVPEIDSFFNRLEQGRRIVERPDGTFDDRPRYSAASRRSIRSIVAGVLQQAVLHGAIASNPTRELERIETPRTNRKAPPRGLTAEERRRLLATVDADKLSVAADLPDIIRFALGSGLRIGEVCAVRWIDLNLEGIPIVTRDDMRLVPVVAVRQNVIPVKGKGLTVHDGKTPTALRVVPLPGFVTTRLDARREGDEDPESPLFYATNRAGERTYRWPSNVRRSVRRIRDEAGLSWMTPHTWRRTYATILDDEMSLTDRAKADLMGQAKFLKDTYVSRGELHPDAAVFLDAALR